MINVADLVLAVKEKKEYQFQLFDKIAYICRNSGEKFSEDDINNYNYISRGNNLNLSLILKDLINEGLFFHVIVQNLEGEDFFFDYFYALPKNCSSLLHPNAKEVSKNAMKYVPGKWEKSIEELYEMSLYELI